MKSFTNSLAIENEGKADNRSYILPYNHNRMDDPTQTPNKQPSLSSIHERARDNHLLPFTALNVFLDRLS